MAFLATQASGGGDIADRLPILKYDARAGRLFTIDRVQGVDGTWQSVQTDITMQAPSFAVDFGTLEVGWAFFAAGLAPMWAVAPYGEPMPAKPASPGNDDKGKPLSYKAAFRVKVVGKSIGGVRELGGNANALIAGLNELHTLFEATREAGAGMIPLVKMVNTLPIKSGQSTNYQPVFEVLQWVERPDPLGPRTVAPPGSPLATAAPAAPAKPNGAMHVPPPAPAAAPAAMPF